MILDTVDLREIIVELTLHHFEVVAHSLLLDVLREKDIDVVAVNDGRGEDIFLVVLIAVEDVGGEFHQLQAARGIDAGGFHQSFLYQFHTAARRRQRVDTEIFYAFLPVCLSHAARSHGKAVYLLLKLIRKDVPKDFAQVEFLQLSNSVLLPLLYTYLLGS